MNKGFRVGQIITTAMAAAVLVFATGMAVADPPAPNANWKQYDAKSYILYTDIDPERVQEVIVRLQAMTKEYTARTKGYHGKVPGKLPFELYKNPKDYYAAGGVAGSSGIYNGKSLMAIASDQVGDRLWHTVQHEGFHQFAAKAITPHLPIWVNEGAAELFGEGLWTGDGMVVGLVPSSRLKRLKEMIRKDLMPFDKMVVIGHDEWNKALNIRNYDQAWSMVHFMVYADDGKYQPRFEAFINDISKGAGPNEAFAKQFGNDFGAFQKRYCEWWLAQKDDVSIDLYAQARVETLTSFLARATLLKAKFNTVDDFFKAGRDGKLTLDIKQYPDIWLPPSLLAASLKKAEDVGQWSLVNGPKPQLRLMQKNGTTHVGTFELSENGVTSVHVEIVRKKAASMPTTGPFAI